MKNFKKILAVVMTIAMVIGSISSTAFAKLTEIGDEGNNLTVYYYDADGDQIGGTYYGSTENFAGIFSGKPYGTESVKISPDAALYTEDITSTLTIPSGEDVTFDLNGKNVATSRRLFLVEGELTILDSANTGALSVTADHDDGNGTIEAADGGTLTIERITITSAATDTPVIYNLGTFVAKASSAGVPHVTGIIAGGDYATYKMSAGYYSADAGAYNAYLDETMERADVTDYVHFEHIADTSGTYNSKIVEQQIVASVGDYNFYTLYDALNYSTASTTAKLLVDLSDDITIGPGKLDLNGHTLTGTINASYLDITDSQTGGKVTGTVTADVISGGTFDSTVNAASITGGTFESAVTATSITGGRFKTTHVTIANGYADGTPESGYTPVIEKRIVENMTTHVQYSSIQAAINEATNDVSTTLQLLDNSDEAEIKVWSNKNITLDTAGFAVTGSITNYGTLVITDSVNEVGSLTGRVEAINNNSVGHLYVSGVVRIDSLSNAGEPINIASDITGSHIGINWSSLTKTCFATDISGASLNLDAYIGTVFTENFDTYKMIVKGTSLYLVSATIDAVSMTLANELAMNYYCTVPSGMLDELSDIIILEVTCAADPENTQYIVGSQPTTQIVEKTDEKSGATASFDQYIFKFDGIDPTWMSQDITARVYIGEEEQEFEAADAYDESVYSVAQYCNELYAIIEYEKSNPGTNPNPNISSENMQSYNAHMETLLADILMYGKTAQLYRGFATEKLCTQVWYNYNDGERITHIESSDLEWITTNKSVNEPTAADNITKVYAKNTNLTGLAVNGEAVSIAGATCMFGKGGFIAPRFLISADAKDVTAGNVAVRVIRYNESGDQIARKVVALNTSDTWGNYYYIELGNPEDYDFQFYPQDFDQRITAEVLVTTSSGAARTLQKVDYSINSYCCYWINQDSGSMSDFALATYRYGASTKALYEDLY